jgi:hypothetical protein
MGDRAWATTSADITNPSDETPSPEPPYGGPWRLAGVTSFDVPRSPGPRVRVVWAWERQEEARRG